MQTCSICKQPGHNKLWHDSSIEKTCRHCENIYPVVEFRKRVKTMVGGERKHYISNVCNNCDIQRCSIRYRSSLKERLRHALGAARHRSKAGQTPFDIDLEYLEYLVKAQEGLCFYTNEPLSEKVGAEGVSIDRKDPSKGYVKGNIALTSWLVNNMKRDLTSEKFIEMCRKIGTA